jgi:hypothetical protein
MYTYLFIYLFIYLLEQLNERNYTQCLFYFFYNFFFEKNYIFLRLKHDFRCLFVCSFLVVSKK